MTKRWFGGAAFLVLAACGSDIALDGADGAFISGNLALGDDCLTTPDSPLLQSGEFDIAVAGTANADEDSEPCRTSYVLRLLTETDADEVALFDRAEVTLRTLNRQVLAFDGLPNPFKLVTAASVRPNGDTPHRGVIEVDGIPAAYAQYLEDLVDSQVLVDVQLHGHLEGGSAVHTQAFGYPVNICEGCLTMCRDADLGGSDLSPADVIGDACPAARSSGMDGRYCIDPDC
jgi:hypothetical protein